MLLALLAPLVLFYFWPLVEQRTEMDLYSGRLRSNSSLFGHEYRIHETDTEFSRFYLALLKASPEQQQWVVCYSRATNLYGAVIRWDTMKREGIPGTLEVAARALSGTDTGAQIQKLPLTPEGQLAFAQRLLEAARLGDDDHQASSYYTRAVAVIYALPEPGGPADFPDVQSALDDASWAQWASRSGLQ